MINETYQYIKTYKIQKTSGMRSVYVVDILLTNNKITTENIKSLINLNLKLTTKAK